MKIYINNFSLTCALGPSLSEVATNLFSEKPRVSKKIYQLVDKKTCPVFTVDQNLAQLPQALSHYESRNNRLILSTLKAIEKDIHYFIEKYGKTRIGVVCGTSTSGIGEGVEAIRHPNKDYNYYTQEIGSSALFIQDYFDLSGIAYTISTACSSGARTFIEAKNLLLNGICDAVIVGGSDSLNDLTLNGFHSLEAVDLNGVNPLSVNRKGINIGEGAAFFILSLEKSKLCYLGGGESSDAYHISSPDPSGRGAVKAMTKALLDAKIESFEIDYINLHGTGTLKNDEMETKAVAETFLNSPYVSSTKPMVGHTLGAAGAIEIAFCALILSDEFNPEDRLPIHLYDGEVDESLSKVNLVTKKLKYKAQKCMSNSYAFGGNNVSLILGRDDE